MPHISFQLLTLTAVCRKKPSIPSDAVLLTPAPPLPPLPCHMLLPPLPHMLPQPVLWLSVLLLLAVNPLVGSCGQNRYKYVWKS